MAVLWMDHRCEKEVHKYFTDGSQLWEGDLIRGWDLDGKQLRFTVERLVSELGGQQSDRHLADALQRRFAQDESACTQKVESRVRMRTGHRPCRDGRYVFRSLPSPSAPPTCVTDRVTTAFIQRRQVIDL